MSVVTESFSDVENAIVNAGDSNDRRDKAVGFTSGNENIILYPLKIVWQYQNKTRKRVRSVRTSWTQPNVYAGIFMCYVIGVREYALHRSSYRILRNSRRFIESPMFFLYLRRDFGFEYIGHKPEAWDFRGMLARLIATLQTVNDRLHLKKKKTFHFKTLNYMTYKCFWVWPNM